MPRQDGPRVAEIAAAPALAQPVSPAVAEPPPNVVAEPTKVVPPTAADATEVVPPSLADPPKPATPAPDALEPEAQPDPTRLDLERLNPEPVEAALVKAAPAEAPATKFDAPTTAKQASPPATDSPEEISPEDHRSMIATVFPAAPFLTPGRRWFGVALTAAVALALVVTVSLTRGNHADGDTPAAAPTGAGTPTSSASASPSAVATTSSPAATTPTNTALPGGWHTYTGSGFSIPVPDWAMSNTSGMSLFRESGGLGRVLGISQSDISNPDPKAALAEQEGKQSSKSGYQRLKLAAVDYRGYEAADWEWLYTTDRGTRIHALRRGFIASGKFYTISWYVAEPNWQENRSSFDLVANGFKLRGE